MGAEWSEDSPGGSQDQNMQGYLGNAENPGFHASVWENQFSLQHEACCGGAITTILGRCWSHCPGFGREVGSREF